MYIKNISVFLGISLLTGCAGSFGPNHVQNSNVARFESTVRQTTNAVNNTAPGFNNINTCPPGMRRINHTAGGGGGASVGSNKGGTSYNVDASFGTGHQCE